MRLEVVAVNGGDWGGVGQFNRPRVLMSARYEKLVMKMGAGGPARRPYETDHLSLFDGRTTFNVFCLV